MAIPERHQVRAKASNSGKWHIGYVRVFTQIYGQHGQKYKENVWKIYSIKQKYWIEIDPETIEPVAVKVNILKMDSEGWIIKYGCPNCSQEYSCRIPLGSKGEDYCADCGQRLDWSEENA